MKSDKYEVRANAEMKKIIGDDDKIQTLIGLQMDGLSTFERF